MLKRDKVQISLEEYNNKKKSLEIKEKSTHPQTYAHLYTGRQTDPD